MQHSLGASAPVITVAQGLDLGKEHFSINKLVVFLPGISTPQIFEGIEGEYNFSTFRLENIMFKRVSLFLDEDDEATRNEEPESETQTLSDILAMGSMPPVPRGDLSHVNVHGIDKPIFLRWQRSLSDPENTSLWEGGFQGVSFSAAVTRHNKLEYAVKVESEGNRFLLDLKSDDSEKTWEIHQNCIY